MAVILYASICWAVNSCTEGTWASVLWYHIVDASTTRWGGISDYLEFQILFSYLYYMYFVSICPQTSGTANSPLPSSKGSEQSCVLSHQCHSSSTSIRFHLGV